MGKNPNAKKLKERKHRERTYSNDIEDLEEEAARQGISVLELQKIREDLKGANPSDEEESGSGDEETKQVVNPIKKGEKKQHESEEEEEVKKQPVIVQKN